MKWRSLMWVRWFSKSSHRFRVSHYAVCAFGDYLTQMLPQAELLDGLNSDPLRLTQPQVKHGKAVFCFIYKYRQRWAVIAREVPRTGTLYGLVPSKTKYCWLATWLKHNMGNHPCSIQSLIGSGFLLTLKIGM